MILLACVIALCGLLKEAAAVPDQRVTPVYRVDQIRAAVAQDPRGWVGQMITYRLRLRAAPELCHQNSAVLCDEGLVLDAAPSPLDDLAQS